MPDSSSSAPDAIDREQRWVRESAGAPRPISLGCSTISHARLGFCSACEPRRKPGDLPLELLGWRLLALRDASAAQQRLDGAT